jgi:hypothetical protein
LLTRKKNFLPEYALEEHTPKLVLAYGVAPNQIITESDLSDFRSHRLDCDDVFQPGFFENFCFYGAKEEDLHVETDATNVLHSWGVKRLTFVPGRSEAKVPSGPYVVANGKTWQPWKIYHDSNACFMTTFKPGKSGSG